MPVAEAVGRAARPANLAVAPSYFVAGRLYLQGDSAAADYLE